MSTNSDPPNSRRLCDFALELPRMEERVRARIAEDVRAAMKARNVPRVAALRSLAAALDNATAVPMPAGTRPNENPEVPRHSLSPEDVRAVLMREITERREAAFTLREHTFGWGI